MNCLFCSIGSLEIKSAVIHENDSALAFLDVSPISLGHTLVIPKKHADNILDLSDADIHNVFSLVKETTNMIEKALSPGGFTIGINQGKIGGQMVDHLHIHIIPRFENDGGGSLHSVVNNPPEEPVEETKKKIIDKN